MEVLLIRHADPDYANDTLTERGHTEARALAEHLRDTHLDCLYASPMGRAQATMRYTAELKGLAATTLDWLHELDGNWEANRWSWNVTGSENLASGQVPTLDGWPDAVPYGPLMLPQYEQLAACFDGLLDQHGYRREGPRYRVVSSSGEVVACFCHAGTILTLLGHLLHWPLPLVYSHLSYDPTGVTRLQWVEHDGYAVPKARTLNDLSHLTRADLRLT
ncbi:MAG: histidine phosphatase family protein [Armatimonadetes bacterium CG_4_10_14_3_um_filter_66_18]|nr:histidine phosphatase family protein [Armatimonadota bacterium]OIP10836.1 MAG: hypothetical protein AUJ96_03220 [Armatimonadetes bacterium CG2_30_66_41]PIU90889.1 MAG: histidine phosphatase family protein [Armatimonadetes bacterium CG06_land_8_20_14_3_00_66_21]PIX38080.1 MAG: histidine phosphatase family protein [Armatimonadetes bacterium CG_4_8_14_3_um_filter_66_20]PIY41017.1 MAG: histidine phosphatase family protein [Armatimonadetes bacterium CG_4_10_14_3_um_filter_66_18]PIZ49860.1 MAG: h